MSAFALDSAPATGTDAYSRVVQALEARGSKHQGQDWQCPGPRHAHGDRNPSLGVARGRKGVLLNCLAGCEPREILTPLGLEVSDLFDEALGLQSATALAVAKPEIEAVYGYVDEKRGPLFDVVRFDPKGFRQRKPDGTWGINGTRRVLFRLPEIIAAAAAGKVVHVAEGEEDVLAIERAGGVATCNPGAGKWKDEYSAFLQGARVKVIADRDEPGIKHAEEVAMSLARAGIQVKIVQAAEGKDARDHLNAGHTLKDFLPVLPAAAEPVTAMTTVPALQAVRVGLGYQATDGELLLRLERLKDSRGDLAGELTIEHQERHLFQAKFYLGSLSARRGTASYLKDRAPGIDWAGILEEFCRQVLKEERRGEPISTVGRLPAREASQMLLDPILPRQAPMLLFAPGGTGKSELATAIAVSIHTGEMIVPGWKPLDACGVLYLDWEASAQELNDRVAAISAGRDLPAPEIFYRRCDRPLTEQVEFLAAFIAEWHIGLVVVDSVGLASGTAKEGTDANESALRLFAALRGLNCATLLVDHVTANDLGSDRATAKAYGSIYKMNLARTVFELRRERETSGNRAELLLLHTKVNDGPKLPPKGLAVIHDPGIIRFESTAIEAPDLVGTLSIRERVYRLVLERGAMMTANIASELGLTAVEVRKSLSRDSRLIRLPNERIAVKA